MIETTGKMAVCRSPRCAFFKSESASSNLSKLMRTHAFWKYLSIHSGCHSPRTLRMKNTYIRNNAAIIFLSPVLQHQTFDNIFWNVLELGSWDPSRQRWLQCAFLKVCLLLIFGKGSYLANTCIWKISLTMTFSKGTKRPPTTLNSGNTWGDLWFKLI